MSEHAQTVPLSNGVTITVVAWSLDQIAANSADFLNLLRAFTASLTTDQPLSQEFAALVVRTVRLSLQRPEDAAHVTARDLPELMQAVWDVNGLGDLVKKLLSLQLQVRTGLQEALGQSST